MTTMADVSASTVRPTIDEVLLEFLDVEQPRLSPRTWRRCADVVELSRACLNGYGYQSLPETDRARWEAACDAGDEKAFCRVFGRSQSPRDMDCAHRTMDLSCNQEQSDRLILGTGPEHGISGRHGSPRLRGSGRRCGRRRRYVMDIRPHHVALSVASLEASTNFYAHFGFRPYSTEVAANAFRIGTLRHESGVMIELIEYRENRGKPPVTYSIGDDLEVIGLKHLALRVLSVQSAREALIQAGYEDVTEIEQAEIDYFFIRDPDGLWVELVQDDRDPNDAAATSCCGVRVPQDVAPGRQETS